jgi:hypothetical protein
MNIEREQFWPQDREAIEALEQPLLEMLEGELLEKLKSGYYQLIIGEDASGRIPALIVADVAKRLAKAEDNKPPKIMFMAGSRKYADKKEKQSRTRQELKRVLAKTGLESNQMTNALIVTEYVASGHSPRPIIWALEDLGFKVDLATMSSINNDGQAVSNLGVNNYYTGHDEECVWGKIISNYRLAGVEKNPEDIYAHKSNQSSTGLIKQSREIASQVAGRIHEQIK